MNIELVKIVPEAANIYSFWFTKPAGFKHSAGEYIEISLDFPKPDERGNRHWYTVAASPTEDYIMIATKFPEKPSTFKAHLRQLQPGDKVQISPPMGDFTLPKDHSKPLLFVAGGIGVTPFRSMAKYISDTNQQYSIQLLYAVNTAGEFAFTELFDNTPGMKVTRMVSEPEDSWQGPVGRLDGTQITKLAHGLADKRIYISGPEPMVKSLQQQLIKAGNPQQAIKIDDFPGYTDY